MCLSAGKQGCFLNQLLLKWNRLIIEKNKNKKHIIPLKFYLTRLLYIQLVELMQYPPRMSSG